MAGSSLAKMRTEWRISLEFSISCTRLFVQLTDGETDDIVINGRKNPLEAWRRLLRRFDPNAAGRKRNLLKTFIAPGRCCMHELQGAVGRWESHVSRYEHQIRQQA